VPVGESGEHDDNCLGDKQGFGFRSVISKEKACANLLLNWLFNIPLNDSTNAFKAYRREVIGGCRQLISAHFNIMVELP
jgi:hypothetical protein